MWRNFGAVFWFIIWGQIGCLIRKNDISPLFWKVRDLSLNSLIQHSSDTLSQILNIIYHRWMGWTVLPFQTKWNRIERFDRGKLTDRMVFQDIYRCLETLLRYNGGFYLKLGNVIKFIKCYVNIKYAFSQSKGLLKRVSTPKYQKLHRCLIVLWIRNALLISNQMILDDGLRF